MRGAFQDPTARQLFDRHAERLGKRLAALDAVIAHGLEDADAGRVKPLQEVADRLTAKYEAQAKARGV
ncbi:hypothetical protein ACQVP2_33200 [Methylobacterium aquaticum]|uniref:hypothetical protein n=1 Tax=Methylobacterium aquaticum TaxID=270351 RepID=UPI003D172B63